MFKGYRTIIINALASILPILELTEVMNVMPPDWQPWYALGLVLLNLFLRAITTTPVGRKEV